MADRGWSLRRVRPALVASGVLLVMAIIFTRHSALGLTRAERDLLTRSIKPSELSKVEAATGGLDSLPLVRLDLTLDLEGRRVTGKAILDWRNSTGHAVETLPIRLASNGDKDEGPSVTWTHLKATMPGSLAVPVVGRRRSAAFQEIKLPKPLASGERVIIEGKLEGHLAQLAEGATDPMAASMSAIVGAKSKTNGDQYGTFACGEHICTLTGFAPDVPAFLDGEFDVTENSGIGDWPYSEPVNLIMDVVADTEVKLATTGMEASHAPAPNLQQRTSFVMAATRQVGFAASADFVVEAAEIDGVHVRSFALSADKTGGATALKAATESIHSFDEAFGHYPWTFLNISESALVGGAGGDELPGLALNGSALYRPASGMLAALDQSGSGGGGFFNSMLDFTTRHEVAHEWWFATVGSHPQQHPYVDEPLAQWSALYSVRKNEGADAAKAARDMQIAVNFQGMSMLGAGDGKVARPAEEFDSMVQYAGLVYGKAPLFFEAAAKQFGEEKVLAGLRAFVSKQAFKCATPKDELDALVHAVGPDKAAAMRKLWRRWFEEKHGDQDVGGLDLSSLMGQLGMPAGAMDGLSGAGGAIDPATLKDTMKALQDLMKDMNGGDPSAHQTQPPPGADVPDDNQ